MTTKTRIAKLERVKKPEQALLVMVQFDNEWTPEQQKEINEAGDGEIIIVSFV